MGHPAQDAESVTGYQILRRRPEEGERVLEVLVNATGTTETVYLDATTPDTVYAYRVKAWRGREHGSAYAGSEPVEHETWKMMPI